MQQQPQEQRPLISNGGPSDAPDDGIATSGEPEPRHAGIFARLSAFFWYPCNLYTVRKDVKKKREEVELQEGLGIQREELRRAVAVEEGKLTEVKAEKMKALQAGDESRLARELRAIKKHESRILELLDDLDRNESMEALQGQIARGVARRKLDRKAIAILQEAKINLLNDRVLDEHLSRLQTQQITDQFENQQRKAVIAELKQETARVKGDVVVNEAEISNEAKQLLAQYRQGQLPPAPIQFSAAAAGNAAAVRSPPPLQPPPRVEAKTVKPPKAAVAVANGKTPVASTNGKLGPKPTAVAQPPGGKPVQLPPPPKVPASPYMTTTATEISSYF